MLEFIRTISFTALFSSALVPNMGVADDTAAANKAARQLIDSLGPQQTFAMLGWQVNSDYMPAGQCFEHWHEAKPLGQNEIRHCEQHAQDLSRLYASYGVDAPPLIFKSSYYWEQKREFDLAWPELIRQWEAAGGNQNDSSYLAHPVCARPLQQGWTGSEYFYDGREHPICRAHKIEKLEKG